MTFQVSLLAMVLLALGYVGLRNGREASAPDHPPTLSAADVKPKGTRSPIPRRSDRLEEAVRGFFRAPDQQARLAHVRRRPFVDAQLPREFESPKAIQVVEHLSKPGLELTMVRADFTDGHVSLLVEELPSGRFVVDTETAHPDRVAQWKVFRESRSTDATSFRVYVSLSDYYNFQFQADQFLALQLELPGTDDIVTGYVPRDSGDASAVREFLHGQITVPMILSLRHAEDLRDAHQLVVARWIQNDWVITDDATAPLFAESGLVEE